MRKNLIFIIIVAIVIGVGALWNSKGDFSSWGKKDTSWYVVYLNNNQIYFGHIASIKDDTLVLENVYFAEAYKEPAQASASKNFALEQTPKQSMRMVRRGDEKILSSDHTLFINRAIILYWEKLTPESEVVKMLKEAKVKEDGK